MRAQISARGISLVPVTPDVVAALYEAELSPELGLRWRHGGRTPGPATFSAGLWSGVLAQFAIHDDTNDELVGITAAYDANLRNGTAQLAFAALPRYQRQGYAILGMALLIEFLFDTWPLRKLYAQSIDFNLSQFSTITTEYFTVEGHLVDDTFMNGRLWDKSILALTRDKWTETAQPWIDLIRGGPPHNPKPST